jgi:BirA family biotin operon repressor/biotin-[acetyl-CoA-carboxylase] ligase
MTLSLDIAPLRQALADCPVPLRLCAYARVGSTQDVVARAALGGAPEGLVVLAGEQLWGRGRAGRSWIAPAGSSLMFSILLRPRRAESEWGTLSLVAGLALVEGLALAGGPQARLKWPNDCLCGERKLAGILSESGAGGTAGRAVVLGVGCNLVFEGVELPAELRRTATACDMEGAPVERLGLAESVLRRLATRYLEWEETGFAGLREAWLQHAAWLGEEVLAVAGDGPVRGRVAGVSETGELVLGGAGGQIVISAGELTLAGGPSLRRPDQRPPLSRR